VIVEVLDRRGVRQRLRLRAFPATIGRGLDNDVILDDRYADPRHALIEWDGGGTLLLVDQGSVNGTFDATSGQRVARAAVRSGSEFRLGRTTLRFMDESHPAEPAVVDAPQTARFRLSESPVVALAIAAVTGVLVAINEYLGKTSRVTPAGMLGESLMMLLVVVVWAGAWALVGRVTQHRFRFLEHFAIACLALSGFICSAGGFEYMSFFFPGGFGWDVLAGAAALAIAVATLTAHLARVSAMSYWPRLLWSLGVIGGLAGIVALSGHRDQVDYAGRFEETPLKAIAARWIPSVKPADFLKQVDGLKDQVDRLAEEEPGAEDEQAPEADSTDD
jgi:hypothetical protein